MSVEISAIDHRFEERDVSRDITSRFQTLHPPLGKRRWPEHHIDEAPNPGSSSNNNFMGQIDFRHLQYPRTNIRLKLTHLHLGALEGLKSTCTYNYQQFFFIMECSRLNKIKIKISNLKKVGILQLGPQNSCHRLLYCGWLVTRHRQQICTNMRLYIIFDFISSPKQISIK